MFCQTVLLAEETSEAARLRSPHAARHVLSAWKSASPLRPSRAGQSGQVQAVARVRDAAHHPRAEPLRRRVAARGALAVCRTCKAGARGASRWQPAPSGWKCRA